jgi:hypothetical protein
MIDLTPLITDDEDLECRVCIYRCPSFVQQIVFMVCWLPLGLSIFIGVFVYDNFWHSCLVWLVSL